MSGGPYDRQFFAEHSTGARQSAERVVPIVTSLLAPQSVVDVGCGSGVWVAEFLAAGVTDVLGIDGEYVRSEVLETVRQHFRAADLSKPLTVERRFDLAVCLEVAEHLPPESADGLVASLTGLAPLVLFSAAIPRQGGTGHTNEQWPEYWAQRFARHGYAPVDALRPLIWSYDDVDVWYAQNMLVYATEDALARLPRLRETLAACRDVPLARVHPRLFTAVAEKYADAVASYEFYAAEAERWRAEAAEHKAKAEFYIAEAEAKRATVSYYTAELEEQEKKTAYYVTELEAQKAKTTYYMTELEAQKAKTAYYMTELEAQKAKTAYYVTELEGQKAKNKGS